MPDSAYLYSDDRPDAWEAPEDGYYDSRWTIPLAWFFFFRPEDVRLIDVHFNASSWQEVRLSAEKRPALDLFEVRRPLLMSLIDRRIGDDAVAGFVSTVAERPGRYLLMDPSSVLGGINCGFDDDQGHARRLASILEQLGGDWCPVGLAREITAPYVKDLSNPERWECHILGDTYW